MATLDELIALVDSLVASRIGVLKPEIAAAIAEGIRTAGAAGKIPTLPPSITQAGISVAFGTVVAPISDTTADILLDGDTLPVPISTLSRAVAGARVIVLFIPPSGAIALGTGGTTVVGGGGTGFVAHWTALGVVIPAVTPFSPIVADGAITAVELAVLRKPAPGHTLLVDVFYGDQQSGFVTLWPDPGDRPAFTSATANPYRVTLLTPLPTTAGKLVQGQIVDGGQARNLDWTVLP